MGRAWQAPTAGSRVMTLDHELRERRRRHRWTSATALAAEDIEARPAWKPMHQQKLFADAPLAGGAVADDLFDSGVCLPSGSTLTDADLDRVIAALRGVLGLGEPRSRLGAAEPPPWRSTALGSQPSWIQSVLACIPGTRSLVTPPG
ncbi:MAG: DegT/DnrJ/EryC1/StrS family aminotransferase [Microthrixaceae bacterium]